MLTRIQGDFYGIMDIDHPDIDIEFLLVMSKWETTGFEFKEFDYKETI